MIVRELTVELGSDHHGFVLDGPVPAIASSPATDSNTLVDWWPDTDPDLAGFVVKTGSQWGPFEVVLRIWDGDPEPASEDWEDMVEIPVELTDGVVVREIVPGAVEAIRGLAGSYRMRVACTGRTESAARDRSLDDDVDEETALERYRIDLWPSAESAMQVIREDSQYAKDQKLPPTPEWPAEREPGLAAAWAIVRDLRGEPGARTLPGELTTLSLSLELPGTKAKLFNRLRYASAWPPCNGGGGSTDPATDYYDATLPEYPGRYEQAGSIVITLIDADKPNQVVRQWNWITTQGPLDGAPRLLSSDSKVTMTFTNINGDGHEPRTLVRLTHEGIPKSWASDLQALWAWDLVNRAKL